MNIDETYQDKLSALALARQETLLEVQERFSRQEILRTPTFSKHLSAVRAQEFTKLGVTGDLAWVQLKGGQTFFSPKSHDSMRRQFEFVGDTLSTQISAETLLAAIDVVQRYMTNAAWPSNEILDVLGGSPRIIELGAYLGHKTVRFGELVRPLGGQVLAVEMMPDNFEIMSTNIQSNGLSEVIDTRQVGIWKSSGIVAGVGKGRQRRSIHKLNQLQDGEEFETEVVTFPDLLTEWNKDPVDLVFATINGAEVEMLEAFTPSDIEIRAWFIAAPYTGSGDGVTGAEYCHDRLSDLGYRLLSKRGQRRVEAVLQ